MKKRNWLRVTSVCMALIMAFGMTGCSRVARNEGESGPDRTSESRESNALGKPDEHPESPDLFSMGGHSVRRSKRPGGNAADPEGSRG